MGKTPAIEELENRSAYEKVLTLPYSDIASFVLGRLTRPSIPTLLVWMTATASLFLSVWFWPGVTYHWPGPQTVRGLIFGLILLPLVLVPIHEGSHLIPFRIAGATDIRLGADLKQGIVWVTAHRFVAGKGLFRIVALTPFLFITFLLIVFIILSPPWWKWTLSMTLLVHTTMCIGDAVLLGFMSSLGKSRVYTWDDVELKQAYFYISAQQDED